MQRSGAKRASMGLISVLLVGGGCADQAPPASSSTEEATVHGTVTVHGNVPSGATISFDPTNIHRKDATPREAEITKNGTYTIKTLVGENSVTVHSPAIDKDAKLSANQKTIDVKSGDNQVPIELP